MNAAAIGQGLARRLVDQRHGKAALMLFAGTLFLSALLLFSVQPMFAKMVLPRLGGSPSVWAVSMCFFQAVLLAGYCYAHALNRYAPARMAPLIHLTLMGLALLALPVGLPATWSEPATGETYFWLIGALAAGVGLPFFAVSANAPLIQAWFSRSGHPHAKDPYFLYGASNLGSLIALLAYPILVEPFAGLGSQAAIWSAGFVALGLGLTACGLAMAAACRLDGGDAILEAAATEAKATSPTWRARLVWVGLAAVPSGLLVAFSSYLTTDIASAPFLWVVPLAAFLATFILVFCDKPKIPHRLMLLVQPVLAAGLMLGLAITSNGGWLLSLVAGSGAFFVTTMVAHRELYERRPASTYLTEFYLFMSLGGVLGGMFAALVAPRIFSTIWEFPLLVVLGMACRPGVLGARIDADERRRLIMFILGAMVVLNAAWFGLSSGLLTKLTLVHIVLLGGLAAFALASAAKPLRQLLATAAMAATIASLPSGLNTGSSERSFFGVHWISHTHGREMRLLMHGTTIHGAERLIDPVTGNRPLEPVPATYYYPGSPMAQGVTVARQASSRPEGLRVGIVGLGAGSMACYSRSHEAWRFFEIDPVVVRIARDAKRFSFLSRCRPEADIVLGDARLTLAKEPSAQFDYLVIDAFSSDAVPVHLLTVEALQLYLDKLTPEGLLALHISNRHLDLVSVAGAVAGAVPGAHAMLADDRFKDKGFDAAQSHVVFVSRSKATLDIAAKLPFMQELPHSDMRPWTDDYSDVLTAMLRKRR